MANICNNNLRRFIEEEIAWATHQGDETVLEALIDRHYTSTKREDWLTIDERQAIITAWQEITRSKGSNNKEDE